MTTLATLTRLGLALSCSACLHLLGDPPAAHAAGPQGTGAKVPRPAACEGFALHSLRKLDQHVPYPPVGKPWPIDVSEAQIVKDGTVAYPSSHHFPPLSVEQARDALRLYVVVPHDVWSHHYSHVGLSDEGGWVATESECFQWIIRPGGLAWIVYPDGTAVYLAGCYDPPSAP
jgi:hypothetical protein